VSADLRAIEISGTVDEEHRLHLDEDVPIGGPSRVRVIILVPGTSDDEVRAEQGDMDEAAWLRAAARNPAFNFLNDPQEDIYTLSDGRPFHPGTRGMRR